MRRWLWAWTSTLLFLGCAHATREQLARRAAFDLDCPEGQLELVELDKRTMGVRGCGKRAVYIEDCRRGVNVVGTGEQTLATTYDRDCTWVLNADATRAE